jgi:hypothetical protein
LSRILQAMASIGMSDQENWRNSGTFVLRQGSGCYWILSMSCTLIIQDRKVSFRKLFIQVGETGPCKWFRLLHKQKDPAPSDEGW